MTEKQFDVSLFKDNIKDLFKTYLVYSSTLTEQSIVKTIWKEVLQQIEDSYRDDVESEKRCNLSVEEYRNYTNTGIQYYTDGQYVMQDGEVYVICNGEHNADVVATALNELLDKTEQLKQDRNEMFIRERDAQNELRDIKKENELLKHENEHLNICLMIEAMYDTSEIELTKCIAKNEQLKQSNQVLSDMCDEYLSSKDFFEHENGWLKKEHKRIQNKVCRLLNHLCDVEGCITREQAKEWWNNEIGDFE